MVSEKASKIKYVPMTRKEIKHMLFMNSMKDTQELLITVGIVKVRHELVVTQGPTIFMNAHVIEAGVALFMTYTDEVIQKNLQLHGWNIEIVNEN